MLLVTLQEVGNIKKSHTSRRAEFSMARVRLPAIFCLARSTFLLAEESLSKPAGLLYFWRRASRSGPLEVCTCWPWTVGYPSKVQASFSCTSFMNLQARRSGQSSLHATTPITPESSDMHSHLPNFFEVIFLRSFGLRRAMCSFWITFRDSSIMPYWFFRL